MPEQTQEVYQILAGYPDGNDAQALRDDPLLQTLIGVSPNEERSLASGFYQQHREPAVQQRPELRAESPRMLALVSSLSTVCTWIGCTSIAFGPTA